MRATRVCTCKLTFSYTLLLRMKIVYFSFCARFEHTLHLHADFLAGDVYRHKIVPFAAFRFPGFDVRCTVHETI